MSSELRASESNGLIRPPSRIGRRPNSPTSKPRAGRPGKSEAPARAIASPKTAQGRTFPLVISGQTSHRRPAPAQGAAEGKREVQKEATAYEDAGDVGNQPAGILHHLQDRELDSVPETRLVESIAGVPQRLVHRDQHVAFLALRRIGKVHETGEILRDVGARIQIVRELLERQRV